MKIFIEPDNTPIFIYVNGDLKAEVIAGSTSTEHDLEKRVHAAYCLMALRRSLLSLQELANEPSNLTCHRVTKRDQALIDLGRGFIDALCGVAEGPTRLSPEHTKSYRAGYSLGETASKALTVGGDI